MDMDMGNINDVSFSILDNTLLKEIIQKPITKKILNPYISSEEKLKIQKYIEKSDINLLADLFITKNK